MHKEPSEAEAPWKQNLGLGGKWVISLIATRAPGLNAWRIGRAFYEVFDEASILSSHRAGQCSAGVWVARCFEFHIATTLHI